MRRPYSYLDPALARRTRARDARPTKEKDHASSPNARYGAIVVDSTFYKNVVVGGGPAPVRAYIEELLPDAVEGRIQPGRVFDRTVGLDVDQSARVWPRGHCGTSAG